jgi:2-dehydro-3-deoxyphosphogluconate aldolase/(4S)-4-hydroxy-2-oxoglutarate aldolase
MGSQLFPKDVIEKKDWDFISRKCSEALEIVSKIRTK